MKQCSSIENDITLNDNRVRQNLGSIIFPLTSETVPVIEATSPIHIIGITIRYAYYGSPVFFIPIHGRSL